MYGRKRARERFWVVVRRQHDVLSRYMLMFPTQHRTPRLVRRHEYAHQAVFNRSPQHPTIVQPQSHPQKVPRRLPHRQIEGLCCGLVVGPLLKVMLRTVAEGLWARSMIPLTLSSKRWLKGWWLRSISVLSQCNIGPSGVSVSGAI